jgi:GntR family transcriptional regulator/MocR family aminotransferase
MRSAPDGALGYPDARGHEELRRVLAGHLRRVRGVAAEPDSIVVCSGATQALALLARAMGGGRIAVEDPGLPLQRAVLAACASELVALGVDERGARVQELEQLSRARAIDAVLVTPAHQAPIGVALSRERRGALLDWARAADAVVIEDDYDAEFRYDRAPLAALQGLAPDRVVYLGTVSKTLAPALRLGWMVLPPRLLAAVIEQKALADAGTPTLEQLALAHLIERGDYDRHLRQARRRYRARRDALLRAVSRHLPQASVTGIAAGLHALLRLGREFDGLALARAARRRSVGVYPLGQSYIDPRPRHDGLVLGYASLAEPAIEEGIRRLALALEEEPGPRPAPTNDGGAIAR